MNRKTLLSALIGALLVSIVYGLPYILIKKQLSSKGLAYHPISVFSDWDEALVYVPLVEEASETGKLTDPALLEHQKTPLMLPPANPIIFGALAKIFGLEPLWTAIDFILPPIIFLLFFAIIYRLIKNTTLSFLLSTVFIFAQTIAGLIPFSNISQLKQFLIYFKPYISRAVQSHLPFDRMFSPEWTFIPLAAFFLLLIIALKKHKTIFYIFPGLAYGFLFYTYFYDWVAVTIILGIMSFIALLRRELKLALNIALTLTSGLAISVFYWLNFWQVTHLPQYQDISLRAGLEIGRLFRWSHLPHYLLWSLGAGWIFFKNKKNPLLLLAASIFIGSIVSLNVQIFTGYVPQPYHWLQFTLSLALFIAYVVCGRELWEDYKIYFEKIKKYLWIPFAVGALLITSRAVQLQINYAYNNAWRYTFAKTIDDSFNWLRTNLKENSVVLTPSFITNTHLMILTPAKIFYPPTSLITSASNQEIVERYLIAAKLFGASDDRLRQLFNPDYIGSIITGPVTPNQHDEESRFLENLAAKALIHAGFDQQSMNPARPGYRDLDDVKKTLTAVLTGWEKDRKAWLGKYSFQYVYVGPYEKSFFFFAEKSFPVCLKKIYKNEGVTIYQICSPTSKIDKKSEGGA